MLQAIICLKNQFSVFLRVAVLDKFYCNTNFVNLVKADLFRSGYTLTSLLNDTVITEFDCRYYMYYCLIEIYNTLLSQRLNHT